MLDIVLRHSFGAFTLDLAFQAPAGVTALFGRSGSGKTTVVNAVAGLLRPDAGRIALPGQVVFDRAAGIDVAVHRRGIGYVFQDARLFPHMTVLQNLRYGAFVRRVPVDAAPVIDLLGLAPLLSRRPAALSGGERQRVAIGRALLSKPAVLLMDEPLAALDDIRKQEILPYIERLRDMAIPILYVSHSVAEVARLATTIVLLDRGRVLRAGPAVQVLSDPDAAPLLGVRDAGAILSATIAAHADDGLTLLDTPAGPLWLPHVAGSVGGAVRVRIAAQDVIVSRDRPQGLSALNILSGSIVQIRAGDGPGALVQIAAGDAVLLARITRRSAAALGLAPGMAVFAILKSVAVAQADIGHAEG